MLNKLFPHPKLSMLLAISWLLLVDSAKPGSIVLALILATLIPMFTALYWPGHTRLRDIPAILGYIGILLMDIVKSNITVASIVLFMPNRRIHPAWVTIPLDLRSPEAITVLASTITLTPGTITADISADGRALLVHCLHTHDADAVRDTIKSRYEARLKRIFE
ncbi:MAG: Na+/H+ antiporter subunit E [Paracoccaceae bacterium]|nr:Na+/H+ antiporter subunit E [Paracoccaceae bacterium]